VYKAIYPYMKINCRK